MERRQFMVNLASLGLVSLANPMDMMEKTVRLADTYSVEQFEDKGLAHFSYAVLAGGKIVLIDPGRNAQPYFDFAQKNNAIIVGVIETHPHADFVSSHLEVHQKLNVPIYASRFTKAAYPLTAFTEKKPIQLTDQVSLRALETPGHAPDHIAIVLTEAGKDKIVFTGDALFLGDVGRPDLLDFSADSEKQRKVLAEQMYDTIHQKFAKLDDAVIVYPSHGAGSLVANPFARLPARPIGYEKQTNYAFEKRTKDEFVQLLLSDQPFIPKYFAHDVQLNNQGAPALKPSLQAIPQLPKNHQPQQGALLIDTRPSSAFQASYLVGALNMPAMGPMETWLGSLIGPESKFNLIAADESGLQAALKKAASIGYEGNVLGTFLYDAVNGNQLAAFNKSTFVPEENRYTILDVRTQKEAKNQPVFKQSINIPLQELASRLAEIPTTKPVLIHCGSGYRSATAASLLKKNIPTLEVYDMGSAVTGFISAHH